MPPRQLLCIGLLSDHNFTIGTLLDLEATKGHRFLTFGCHPLRVATLPTCLHLLERGVNHLSGSSDQQVINIDHHMSHRFMFFHLPITRLEELDDAPEIGLLGSLESERSSPVRPRPSLQIAISKHTPILR